VVATDTITKSIVTDENVAAEEIDNTEVETKISKTQNIQSNAASLEKAIKTKEAEPLQQKQLALKVILKKK
jgi:hypothetical protein